MRSEFAALWIRALSKTDLETMIAGVKRVDEDEIARAIVFFRAESFGYWHNRARAKLCRHFKNHPPSPAAQNEMIDAIISRLVDGRFYEQFKDQLRMAIRFSPSQMRDAAQIAANSSREYVRRYADWVEHTLDSQQVFRSPGNQPMHTEPPSSGY